MRYISTETNCARTACDQLFLQVDSTSTYQETMVRMDFILIQLRGEQTQQLEKHCYSLNYCIVITEETEVASREAPEKNSGGGTIVLLPQELMSLWYCTEGRRLK